MNQKEYTNNKQTDLKSILKSQDYLDREQESISTSENSDRSSVEESSIDKDSSSSGDRTKPSDRVSDLKPNKEKKYFNSNILVGVLLGLFMGVLGTKMLSSSNKEKSVDTPQITKTVSERTVTAVEVQNSSVDRTLNANGTVEAKELVTVMSEASGLQIERINVDEGDYVNRGRVLASLKNNKLKAELFQQQAALDGAKARLAELQSGSRNEEITQAKERVQNAQSRVEQTKFDLELVATRVKRNENLQAEGAISRDRLDELKTQERVLLSSLQGAKAQLREAQEQLKLLQKGERSEVIDRARSEVRTAEGRIKFILAQLDETTIKAPVSGIIAERNVSLGEITSSSANLFTIIENGNLELRLEVPETEIGRVKPGQQVNIIPNRNISESIAGIVREIKPIINSDSRQAIVRVDLPREESLRSGMFLEANIVTGTGLGKTVPIKALLPQPNGTAIAYVILDDNTVKAQTVEIGEILPGKKIEVLKGLEIGDRIVVEGSGYLKNGDRVSIE